MTLSRQVTSAAGLYALAAVIARMQFFFTLPLISRSLSPSEYGILTIAGAVMVFVASTVQSTVSGAVERFYADYDDAAREECLGTIFAYLLLLSGGLLVVIAIALPQVSDWVNVKTPGTSTYFLLAAATGAAAALNAFVTALFRIEEKPLSVMAVAALRFTSAVALLFALVGALHQGVFGYLAALLTVEVLVFIVTVPYVHRRIRLRLRGPYLREVIAFSLPLAPYVLLAMLRDTGDRWILQRFVSLEQLGLYGFAWGVAGAMNIVVSSLAIPYSATMMKRFKGNASSATVAQNLEYFIPGATHVMVLTLLAYAGYLLLVRDAIQLLTPDRYHAAWLPASLLGGVFVLRALYLIPHNVLQWTRRTSAIPLATAAGVVFGLLLIALAARPLGVIAGVLGIAVCYIVSWATTVFFLPRPRWLLPVHALPVLGALGIVVVAAVIARLPEAGASVALQSRHVAAFALAAGVSIWLSIRWKSHSSVDSV